MRLVASAIVAIGLAGCDAGEGQRVDLGDRLDEIELRDTRVIHHLLPNHLDFGFELRGTPDDDARQYLPLLAYLEEATGRQFDLHLTAANEDIAEQLGTGRLHLAALGGYTYVRARKKYGVIPLVRGLNAGGDGMYRGVIVVRPTSRIRDVSELRRKRFAFGNPHSTQGHLIPRYELLKQEISLDDLEQFEYFGTHQACANAVIDRRVDACGMQDILGVRLADEGVVRIIHVSDPFPSSGIAANKDLPADFQEEIRSALVALDSAVMREEHAPHWDRTEMAGGFIKARDEDYAPLRELIAGLGLHETSAPEQPPSD